MPQKDNCVEIWLTISLIPGTRDLVNFSLRSQITEIRMTKMR